MADSPKIIPLRPGNLVLSDPQVDEILKEFEAVGVVRRTGETRNGRPVYVLTEIGKELDELMTH